MRLRIGDMAQLVERRVRNAKVRGSNPLISTTKISYKCTIFFLCGIGDSPRFHRGVALQHEPLRADADAITEASRSLPTNPLISTSQNTS